MPANTNRASDHTTTLLPLEAWAFQSPGLARIGRATDVGGLAEALIYYERVLVNAQSPGHLVDLFASFAASGQLDALTAMLKDQTIRLCHFAFTNDPFQRVGPDGRPFGPLFLMNAQTSEQAAPGWLDSGLLNKLPLEQWLSRGRRRAAVLRAIRDGAVEVKAQDFGAAVRAAEQDVHDVRRAALFVQALVDDARDLLGRKESAEVIARTDESRDQVTTTWNVNLPALGASIGHPRLEGHHVLRAAAEANRLLWLAAQHRVDLFAGSPMSQLIGDKLEEVYSARADKPQRVVQSLEANVDFPDVRALVNEGRLPISEVMRLRSKAGRFQGWLRSEAERDRDAIIAYHNEVAKDAGFTRVSRRLLRLFAGPGAFAAGTTTTAAVFAHVPDATTAGAAGALASTFTKLMMDALSKHGEEWKPVVFGKWATEHIEKYLHKAGES